jgi:hypothetical protein
MPEQPIDAMRELPEDIAAALGQLESEVAEGDVTEDEAEIALVVKAW